MVAPDPTQIAAPSTEVPSKEPPLDGFEANNPAGQERDGNNEDEDEDDDDAVPDLRGPSKDNQLRQRRGPRASPPPLSTSPPPPRRQNRSSSFASNASASSRPSFRSTDSFFSPGVPETHQDLHADHEPSLWYSAPLLLALVPAIAGVAFKRGATLITDIALLSLAAIYLNWCLVTPWTWYREARAVRVADDDTTAEEAIAEDLDQPKDENEGEAKDEGQAAQRSASAAHELALHELSALLFCFIGPLVGAWLLHTIRTSLSSFGDELVSNMHLTLFVLGAELRPARHAIKLVHARTLHLQRVVRVDPLRAATSSASAAAMTSEQMAEMHARLDELERDLAHAKATTAPTSPSEDISAATGSRIDILTKANAALQSQTDALTRAVRRYEKRATAQTLATETTLADLDARVADALALAASAAASETRRRNHSFFNVAGAMIRAPFATAWRAIVLPLGVIAGMLVRGLEKVGLVSRVERKRPSSRKSGAGSSGSSRLTGSISAGGLRGSAVSSGYRAGAAAASGNIKERERVDRALAANTGRTYK